MCAAAPRALQQQLGILEDAIGDRRRLVLTFLTATGWTTYQSRFYGGSSGAGDLQIRATVDRAVCESGVPKPGDIVGATFRVGHRKCMFSSVVESVERGEDGVLFSVRWPEQLKQMQRRAYERATPPNGAVVAVRLWREISASGPNRDVRHGQVEDLSAGGMRIKVANTAEFELGATYRCVFTPRHGKPSIIADVIVRHREAADHGRASIGLQFIGLETSTEGRRALDRLARTVRQFQRGRAHPS